MSSNTKCGTIYTIFAEWFKEMCSIGLWFLLTIPLKLETNLCEIFSFIFSLKSKRDDIPIFLNKVSIGSYAKIISSIPKRLSVRIVPKLNMSYLLV